VSYKTLVISLPMQHDTVCNWQINGESMVNKSQDDALVLLRNAPTGSSVQLVVSRQALKQSAPNNVVVVYLFIFRTPCLSFVILHTVGRLLMV